MNPGCKKEGARVKKRTNPSQSGTSSESSGGIISSAVLLSDPLFKHIPALDLSRLLVHAQTETVPAGEPAVLAGAPADSVLLIEKGRFQSIRNKEEPVILEKGLIGIEAALGSDAYVETVEALDTSTVISFPAAQMRRLLENNKSLNRVFFNSFVAAPGQETPVSDLPAAEVVEQGKKVPFPFLEVIGWLLIFVGSYFLHNVCNTLGFPSNASIFLMVLMATVIMWVFQLVPNFIPPLFGLTIIILMDVAPPKIALSGFSSGAFFMCLSVFGIGALMISSGLTYRLSLMILQFLPPTRFWYSLSLFLIGFLLTPIVPSLMGRMVITLPFLIDILGMSRVKENDPIATQLVNSAFQGVFIMSPIFLTGHPVNLILFGMFDYQSQYAFQWVHWLFAASLCASVTLVSYFAASSLLFRKAGKLKISKTLITEQLKIIRPITANEQITLFAVLIMAVGIMTTSFHKVEIPWLTLAVLSTLVLFETIGGLELRSNIDWPTLILMGSILAWAPILSATGLDKIIMENLSWLGYYMKHELLIFIAYLCGIILLVRLVLPGGATAIILATAMFPIANQAGVTIWLIAFIILVMADTAVFPYQSPLYIRLKSEMSYHKMDTLFSERRIIVFNIILVAARILGIYASLPFWKYLDFI